MRNIPGCELPTIKRQAIDRLTKNIIDQSQEIEMLKSALVTMEHELDLARVTLLILEQSNK